jgi:hypothetical protein
MSAETPASGIHHGALGELDADPAAVEEPEQRHLIYELGQGRVSRAVALAAVTCLEAVRNRHGGRIQRKI